jgi:hypothetical protein
MKNSLVLTIILVILIGIGSFFGGMKYGQSQRRSAFGQFANSNISGQRGLTNGNRVGNGFRPINGDIINSDANSITVKMSDGSTKIVIVSGSTSINKAAQATIADLTTGQKVAVFGQTNSDGSVTAQSIQLNPIERLPGGNPNQNPIPTK